MIHLFIKGARKICWRLKANVSRIGVPGIASSCSSGHLGNSSSSTHSSGRSYCDGSHSSRTSDAYDSSDSFIT